MKKFLLLLLTTICTYGIYAQKINVAKMDSLFQAIEANNKGMGSIAIAKNGKNIYKHSSGYSFISDKDKIKSNSETKYRIGSITKMFTAVLALQLIEEGKLSLKTHLTKFFPTIPHAKDITIENLLNHHSGIHNFTEHSEITAWGVSGKSRQEMISIISADTLDFAPGTKGFYSNSNFVLLGFIIEDILKLPYRKILEEKITRKLNLTNTYFSDETNKNYQECYSYSFVTDWKQVPRTSMSVPGGAGAIVSTPEDLTAFIYGLFTGKLLKAESLEKMKTFTDGFGLGIFSFPFENRNALGHSGMIDGFVSNIGFFPDDSLAIAYCSNYVLYEANSITIGALNIYYGKPYLIPQFKSFAVSSESLDKYLGNYDSKQHPLQVQMSKKGNVLMALATGQPPLALDAVESDKFSYEAAGILVEFNPEKNEFTLKQGGKEFLFTRIAKP